MDDNAKEKSNEAETLEDPLTTLRDRYFHGELTDEQFKHKLEQLLTTETLEDIEQYHHERLYEHGGRWITGLDSLGDRPQPCSAVRS